MNERIRKLIIETDEWLENNAQSDRWEREVKFAELIVRECANVVFNKTGPKSALNVLEHFGVEE